MAQLVGETESRADIIHDMNNIDQNILTLSAEEPEKKASSVMSAAVSDTPKVGEARETETQPPALSL